MGSEERHGIDKSTKNSEKRIFLINQVHRRHQLLIGALISKKNNKNKDNNSDTMNDDIIDNVNDKTTTGEIINKEREKIRKILSIDKNLKRRSIVGDLEIFNKTIGGKEEPLVKFCPKYGLKGDVFDLNSFLDYCSIHSFIPMVDKIIINGKDISMSKNIFEIFYTAIDTQNWTILNSLSSDIKREYGWSPEIELALSWIKSLLDYRNHTYQYLFGLKLAKLKQIGSISERIYSEAANKIENDVINKLGIKSSGMKLTSYLLDRGDEADLIFKFWKKEDNSLKQILTQLTIISDDEELAKKEQKVEGYLFSKKIREFNDNNFVIISVNGDFEKKVRSMCNEYVNKFKDNPSEREKSTSGDFPLFVDSLSPEIIQPAYITYIALNMLYKRFNFKFSTKENYLKSHKFDGAICPYNSETINCRQRMHGNKFAIELGKIDVHSASVTTLIRKNNNSGNRLVKHKYPIFYDGVKMGTIVIYGIKKSEKN